MDIATEQPKNTQAITSVDKRTNLSKKEFINEYVIPCKPVVITDAAKNWKAIGRWTPEYFKTNYADVEKTINGVPYKMDRYIDLMLKSTPEHPAPYPYSMNMEDYFPELLEDIKPTLLYSKMDRINHPLLPKMMLVGTKVHEIFFGGNGSNFPFLHYDALCMNTQITQVYGSKEFYLFAPDQTPYLYPREDNPKISQIPDILNVDLKKYPLFSNAKLLKVMVDEGETLFFAQHWWHIAKIHGPCITYGRAQLGSNNWKNFVTDNYQLYKKSSPAAAYLVKMYGSLLGSLMSVQESFISA